MTKQLFLSASILLFVLGAPALRAAEPSGGGGGGGGDPTPFNPPPIERDSNSGTTNFSDTALTAGLLVQGRVFDSSGKWIEGVKVKLFSAGLLVSTALTDNEGKFKISGDPDFSKGSADLWFASPSSHWVDSSVLLTSGPTSATDPLRPACTPVIPLLGGSASIEMKMLTFDERREEISRSRCLETAQR